MRNLNYQCTLWRQVHMKRVVIGITEFQCGPNLQKVLALSRQRKAHHHGQSVWFERKCNKARVVRNNSATDNSSSSDNFATDQVKIKLFQCRLDFRHSTTTISISVSKKSLTFLKNVENWHFVSATAAKHDNMFDPLKRDKQVILKLLTSKVFWIEDILVNTNY